ncbi:MAG: insulinase family protein [Clostridia bacterium]|nr:insulinase family protein [Clostridia bacterium]
MSEIITLSGGLRLAYQYIPHIRSVSLGVFVKIGSGNELAEDNGVAHFTEHVLFKGTEKRTAFDIVRDMDALGANMNAYTSKEVTAFYFQCTDDVTEPCAEILSDLLLHSTFPASELDKERGVILEEIGMVADTPDDLSQDLSAAAFWGEYPYGRTILGSADNVRRFTSSDIHSFVAKHYVAGKVVVSIAGHISREEAIALTEKYFRFPDRPVEDRTFTLPTRFGGRVSVEYKDIEQANLTFAFPSVSSVDDRASATSVLSVALGGGMSSLLFQEIRERLGLVYSVYDYPSLYERAGAHSIYLGTNPKNLSKAVRAMKKCLADFREKGLDEETMHRAKMQVKTSLILGSESSMAIMRLQGRMAIIMDRAFDLDERVAEIDRMTIDDVNAMIRTIFSSRQIGVGYVGIDTGFDLSEIYE